MNNVSSKTALILLDANFDKSSFQDLENFCLSKHIIFQSCQDLSLIKNVDVFKNIIIISKESQISNIVRFGNKHEKSHYIFKCVIVKINDFEAKYRILNMGADEVIFDNEPVVKWAEYALSAVLKQNETNRKSTAWKKKAETYGTLLNSSPESFVLIERNGIVIGSNSNLENLTINSSSLIPGSNLISLVPIETAALLQQALNDIGANRLPQRFESKIGDKYLEHSIRLVPNDEDSDLYLVFSQDITERVNAIEALRHNEEILRYVITNVPVGIWILNSKRTITFSEGKLFTQLIFGNNIMFGACIDIVLKDEPGFLNNVNRALSGEISISSDTFLNFSIENHYTLMHHPSGTISGLLCVSADNTEIVHASKNVRLNEERLQIALDAAGSAMWDLNLKTQEYFYSPKYYHLLGYDNEDTNLNISTFPKLIHPDDYESYKRAELLIKEGYSDSENVEYRIVHKNGNWIWLNTIMNGLEHNLSGNPLRIIGTNSDISDRKNNERQIIESEALLKSLINSNDSLIALIDHDFVTHAFNNNAFEAVLNYLGKYLKTGESLLNVLPKPISKDIELKLSEVFSGISIQKEHNLVEILGFDYWVEIKIIPIQISEGSIDRISIFITPINARKIAELKLKEREETLNAILETSPVGIAMITNSNIIWSNTSFTKLLGYKEEMSGYSLDKLYNNPIEAEMYFNMYRPAALRGELIQNELKLLKKDKSFIDVWLLIKKISEESGEPNYIVVIMDITEKLNAQKQKEELLKAKIDSEQKKSETEFLIEKSARLASIGVIAGGITHEINQPLNAIRVAADGMLFWNEKNNNTLPDKITKLILRISEGSTRIDEIIQHMRSFWVDSSKQALEIIDLNICLEKALTLVSQRLSSHEISVIVKMSHSPLLINANRLQAELIINNLITNSIQSLDMKSSGRKELYITSENIDSNILLKISDSGIGLPDIDPEKLFDPFFSTKKHLQGTGLGLAIVKMFLKRFGAEIKAENNSMGGADFTVYFNSDKQKSPKQ